MLSRLLRHHQLFADFPPPVNLPPITNATGVYVMVRIFKMRVAIMGFLFFALNFHTLTHANKSTLPLEVCCRVPPLIKSIGIFQGKWLVYNEPLDTSWALVEAIVQLYIDAAHYWEIID